MSTIYYLYYKDGALINAAKATITPAGRETQKEKVSRKEAEGLNPPANLVALNGTLLEFKNFKGETVEGPIAERIFMPKEK